MNAPRVRSKNYIDFLIGTQRVYICTEAERGNPEMEIGLAHDAYARLLQRMFPTSERLWEEARGQVYLRKGVLVIDDSTFGRLYSRQIDRVTRRSDGKRIVDPDVKTTRGSK